MAPRNRLSVTEAGGGGGGGGTTTTAALLRPQPKRAGRGSVSIGGPMLDSDWSGPEEPSTFLTEPPHRQAAECPAPAPSPRRTGSFRAGSRAGSLTSAQAAGIPSNNPVSALAAIHKLPEEQKRTAREKAKAALEALLAMSAEAYVELAFEAAVDSRFELDEEMEKAAKGFDDRYKELSSEARGHLVQLQVTPTDIPTSRKFDSSLQRVFRNR
jgi:hypothetical protein